MLVVVCMLLVEMTAAQSQFVQANMVACWDFDNAVTDACGARTMTKLGTGGPTYSTGKFGDALVLDNDYTYDTGTFTSLGIYSSSYTISAWVYPTTLADDHRIISSVNPNYVFQMGFNTGSPCGSNYCVRCRIHRLTDGLSEVNSGVTVVTSTWYHVACVHDRAAGTNGELIVYVDGVARASVGYGTANADMASSNNLYIGSNDGAVPNGYCFRGYIDQLIVWKVPLTPSEISTLYGSGSGFDVVAAASVVGDPVVTSFGGVSHALTLHPGVFNLLTTPTLSVNALVDIVDTLPEQENFVITTVGIVALVDNTLVKVQCKLEALSLNCKGFQPSSRPAVTLPITSSQLNEVHFTLDGFNVKVQGHNLNANYNGTWIDVGFGYNRFVAPALVEGLLVDLDRRGVVGVQERLALNFYTSEEEGVWGTQTPCAPTLFGVAI